MWRYADIALRVVALLAGLWLIYVAIFTYEDEQGKIQDALIKLWSRIDDNEKKLLSAHTLFMREVARFLSVQLDRLFGNKIFSLQSIGVSAAFSMASFWLIAFFEAYTNFLGRILDLDPLSNLSLPTRVVLLMVYLFLGSMPLFIDMKTWRTIWFEVVFMATFFAAIFLPVLAAYLSTEQHGHRPSVFSFDVIGSCTYLLGLTVGVVSDFFFIALTRITLRWSSNFERFSKALGVLLLNCLFAVTAVSWPFIGYWRIKGDSVYLSRMIVALVFLYYAFIASTYNAFSILLSLAYLFLALLMLVHRMFWPLLSRPTYALERIGMAKRNKLLAVVGLALIGYASGVATNWMKELLKML